MSPGPPFPKDIPRGVATAGSGVLSWIERLLVELRPIPFALFLACVQVFKAGIWSMPNLEMFRAISENPFVNRFADPAAHYLFGSWLGAFGAWALGMTGPRQFFLFHLLFAVGFLCLFAFVAFSTLSERGARTALVLFAMLPVSSTVLIWIGPDAITLMLMMLAIASSSRPRRVFMFGILLGMQHFEQGAFAVVALFVASIACRRIDGSRAVSNLLSPSFYMPLGVGVLAGKLGLLLLFHWADVRLQSGRAEWMSSHLGVLPMQFLLGMQAVTWSILGPAWIFAIRHFARGRHVLPFYLALAAISLLLPWVADHTRVIAIVSFPLLCAFWLMNDDLMRRVRPRQLAWILAVWVLMPLSWVWQGIPERSVFPHSVLHLLGIDSEVADESPHRSASPFLGR